MRSFLFGLLTLCIWAIPARYFYVCKIKNQCGNIAEKQQANTSRYAKTLQLTLGDSIVLDTLEQFYFAPASTQAKLSDNNRIFLQTIAQQLLADSLQSLSLTAAYRPSENSMRQGFFENLGMARADGLKKLLEEEGIDGQRIQLKSSLSPDEAMEEAVRFDLFYTLAPDSTTQITQ